MIIPNNLLPLSKEVCEILACSEDLASGIFHHNMVDGTHILLYLLEAEGEYADIFKNCCIEGDFVIGNLKQYGNFFKCPGEESYCSEYLKLVLKSSSDYAIDYYCNNIQIHHLIYGMLKTNVGLLPIVLKNYAPMEDYLEDLLCIIHDFPKQNQVTIE